MMLKLKICVLIIIFSEVNSQNSCGVPKIGSGNIFFGSDAKHGQFPWMSVITKLDIKNKFKFSCGGSLISSKHVLTAAHCVLESLTMRSLPRDLRVLLGMFDLDDVYEVGRQAVSVDKIHIHDDWNPSTVRFDADITLLELGSVVQFTNYVQPICLWTSNSEPSAVKGIVVGYGKSENESKKHENLPKMIEVPIHTQEHCFIEQPQLVAISSKRTFCAGAGDGSGVCHGDSGGGLFVKVSNVYYLRGIISSSLINEGHCDVFNYGVFTNVLKFSDWINTKMNQGSSFQQTTPISMIKTTLQPFTLTKTTVTPIYKIQTTVKTTTSKVRSLVSPTVRSTLQPMIKSTTTKVKNFDECGVMSASTGLIQAGKFSTVRDFSWIALIIVDQKRHITDQINHKGGVLISHKHVVASAYTLSYWDKSTQKDVLIALNRLKVHLAALQKSHARQVFDPVKIVRHPQYRLVDNIPVNNVAVITIDRTVYFDDFIRPICLWTFSDDLSLIANSPIYAVGYGFDETGMNSNIKKHAKVTLQDQTKCEESYSHRLNILKATKTICIKGDEFGAPCKNDVHIFVKYNDKWFLRGTLLRFFSFDGYTCSVNEPFLYEDNAQHSKWIKMQIDS